MDEPANEGLVLDIIHGGMRRRKRTDCGVGCVMPFKLRRFSPERAMFWVSQGPRPHEERARGDMRATTRHVSSICIQGIYLAMTAVAAAAERGMHDTDSPVRVSSAKSGTRQRAATDLANGEDQPPRMIHFCILPLFKKLHFIIPWI